MKESLLKRQVQTVGLSDRKQMATYNLRRAFPLAGTGEFNEQLAALDTIENKHW